MKKIVSIAIIIFTSITFIGISFIILSSCRWLFYSISGKILDPVGDFSDVSGRDKETYIFGGNNYIVIDELCGDFEIFKEETDIILGERSNFPFFPNTRYYADTMENPEYITSGNSSVIISCVYLREDLYSTSLRYVLKDVDYEFDFSTAFIKTDEVSYETHVQGKENHSETIRFYLKDFPKLTAEIRIYEINEKWYYEGIDEVFELSEDFVNVLAENNLLSE